jgi:hypothetical protein
MRTFAIGIERALNVAVQRSHNANARLKEKFTIPCQLDSGIHEQ